MELGKEAAAEVRQQYPIITDDQIAGYLDQAGRSLVKAAPANLNNPVFEYSFTPVNFKEINAFALPGGPMFVNRGMFDAADGEGEVVGVMAHELAHVLLRHGTANATKAQKFQIGAVAGAIAGAIIGGGWGEAISQGSQLGLGAWLMKYSREYEKQADLLGAQIMARAGHDPRELARMFEAIEKQSKGSPPQWLSSHPNPGNRVQYIRQEADKLTIGARPSGTGFAAAKARFAAMPPAKSMADAGRTGNGGGGSGGSAPVSVGTVGQPVPAPATQYKTAKGGELFQVSVPSNWTRRVGQQLREVRAAERARRLPGPERLHPRRGTRRGARVVTHALGRHQHLRERGAAGQPGHARGRRAAAGAHLAAGRHRHGPRRPVGAQSE